VEGSPDSLIRRIRVGLIQTRGADALFDFACVREAIAFGELRKEELAIDADIEHPAAAGFEFGIDTEAALEFCSQTDRSGLVVSDRAVLDVKLHAHNLDQAPTA